MEPWRFTSIGKEAVEAEAAGNRPVLEVYSEVGVGSVLHPHWDAALDSWGFRQARQAALLERWRDRLRKGALVDFLEEEHGDTWVEATVADVSAGKVLLGGPRSGDGLWVALDSNRVLPRNAITLPRGRMLEEGMKVAVHQRFLNPNSTAWEWGRLTMVRRIEGGSMNIAIQVQGGEEVVLTIPRWASWSWWSSRDSLVPREGPTRREIDLHGADFLQQFLMESKAQSVRAGACA
jgi:hypothetical protein